MRPPRLLIAIVVSLAALLAAGLTVAAADDGKTDVTASAVMLEPGDNFAGWIEESIAVEDLFDALPEIEIIFFWDAADRHWRMAAPAMPSRFWTLDSVDPGMAVLVRNGSDETVEWIPQSEPARGRVELHEGTNWVSWAGPDDWSVEQVAKGIGRALVSVQRGDTVYDVADPDSAKGWSPVSRGESLEVTVRRPVNWLQPTYMMPNIEFPGGAPAILRERVRDDVRSVLDFYARTWGIQADANSTILVPSSVTALIQRCREEVVCTSEEELAIRAQWSRVAGWADWKEMIVKQDLWSANRTGRYVLSHEYAHWLQYELADSGTPTWLLEGTASWAHELHRVEETNQTLTEWRALLEQVAARGPSLESAEEGNSTWQYTLGARAIDMLSERSGIDAPFELYRSLRTLRPESGGDLSLTQAWQGVFSDVFGIGHDAFYQEFEDFQNGLPGRSAEAKAAGEQILEGELFRADGSAVSDGWVTATPLEQGVYVHWTLRSDVEADGSFRLFVPSNTDVQLRFDLGEEADCSLYIGYEGLVTDAPWEARVVRVGIVDPPPLRVEIPTDACRLYISGVLLDSNDSGVSHVSLMAIGTSITEGGLSNEDGFFRIPVPRSGTYRIASWSEGCLVYFSAQGVTGDQDSADVIEVTDESITGLRFQLSGNPCRSVISGRLLNEHGEGIVTMKIFAQTQGANPAFDWTDQDGYFSIPVPKEGSYFLYSPIRRACFAIYRVGTATGRRDQATYISVDTESVDDLRFVVPAGLCSIEIRGRVIGSSGEGVSNVRVRAAAEGGHVGDGASDRDGIFSIPVTEAGSYHLFVYGTGNCTIYMGTEGPVRSRNAAEQISVSDADVTDIEFRLPEDPSTFCD